MFLNKWVLFYVVLIITGLCYDLHTGDLCDLCAGIIVMVLYYHFDKQKKHKGREGLFVSCGFWTNKLGFLI